MRVAGSLLAALLAAAVAACGGPTELSQSDGVELDRARDRTVAALDTARRLDGSPAAARRLLARVRRIVAAGALEPKQLDEFGLAALGELRLAVPSLVIVDRQEVPRQLDRPALTTFLANAETDPDRALRPAAAAETARIAAILDRADADPESEIPVVDTTVDVYLADLAGRLRPVWPELAARLEATRAEL